MQKEQQFDFTKKIEKVLENTPIANPNKYTSKEKIRWLAFLVLGSVALGAGFGGVRYFTEDYLLKSRTQLIVDAETMKNEELRKNTQLEVNLALAKENILKYKEKYLLEQKQAKEDEKQKEKKHQIYVLSQKNNYAVWIKNKDAVIHNFNLQLNMYNSAYQLAVNNAKNNLIDLNELDNIRALYQSYKDDIRSMINFVQQSLLSFDTFYQLSDDDQHLLQDYLNNYQNGGLNRSNELEIALINSITTPYNDESDAMAKLRYTESGKMRNQLASILSTEMEVNKNKKLKQ